jgi:two-component system LytT family response regulator
MISAVDVHLNILVVENDLVDQNRCCGLIAKIIPNAKIFRAQLSQDVLDIVEDNRIDLAFIDKSVPDMDGFELADIIRKNEQHLAIPMIFIARANDPTLEEVNNSRHYGFLTKPYSEDAFNVVAGELLRGVMTIKESNFLDAWNMEHSRVVIMKSKGIEYRINFSDILYAELNGDSIILYTKYEIVTDIHISLSELIKQIDDDRFRRCHKSFAVNTDNIYKYKKMSNKVWYIYFGTDIITYCPVSNSYHKEIHDKISPNTPSQGDI